MELPPMTFAEWCEHAKPNTDAYPGKGFALALMHAAWDGGVDAGIAAQVFLAEVLHVLNAYQDAMDYCPDGPNYEQLAAAYRQARDLLAKVEGRHA